jgi:catechol 2,3-dioxygenase-like lactoylglutathione lyase family enzyme
MKRFHVHVAVDDLATNIRFYSTVFGMPPTVEKSDYAKWMLEDPRLNFAISQRGLEAGIDHLGLQVETDEELTQMRGQVGKAEIAALDQTNASCCYAKSDKYWVTDPQGIAWETFRTLDSIPVYGNTVREQPAEKAACCAPAGVIAIQAAKNGACCS